jgi:hypothetical protein
MTEVSFDNAYAVLALPTNATTDDVVQTYHATVRQYHPDYLKKRDASSMDQAKSQFMLLTRAYDMLVDPINLRAYDEAWIWYDFISVPFGWTEKGSPSLNKWINASWLGLLLCVSAAVGIYALLDFSGPLMFAYLATTYSSPMIMSFIPFIAGLVGACLGVIVTGVAVAYLIVKHPYSARHSSAFWLYVLFDVMLSYILTLTLSLAFVGMIVGYYLF